jgi:hypothetical protein
MDQQTPTPEEIAKACAEIREGWSKQRWKNQHGHSSPWHPPVVGKYVHPLQKSSGSDLQR